MCTVAILQIENCTSLQGKNIVHNLGWVELYKAHSVSGSFFVVKKGS